MSQTIHRRPRALAIVGLVVGVLCLAFATFALATTLQETAEVGLSLVIGVVPLIVGLALVGRFVAKYLHKVGALVGCAVIALAASAYIAARLNHIAGVRAAFARSRAIAAFCEGGAPLPEAPPASAAGPHSIRVAVQYGDESESPGRARWTEVDAASGFPDEWRRTDLPELVACLRSDWTVFERRQYSGGGRGGEMVTRQHHYDIDVYESRTRRVVFHTRLDGAAPPPLPESYTTGHSSPIQRGPRASASAVVKALQPTVRGP